MPFTNMSSQAALKSIFEFAETVLGESIPLDHISAPVVNPDSNNFKNTIVTVDFDYSQKCYGKKEFYCSRIDLSKYEFTIDYDPSEPPVALVGKINNKLALNPSSGIELVDLPNLEYLLMSS